MHIDRKQKSSDDIGHCIPLLVKSMVSAALKLYFMLS